MSGATDAVCLLDFLPSLPLWSCVPHYFILAARLSTVKIKAENVPRVVGLYKTSVAPVLQVTTTMNGRHGLFLHTICSTVFKATRRGSGSSGGSDPLSRAGPSFFHE